MSEKPLYYDRQGQPLATIFDFGRLFEDFDYKRVRFDEIGDQQVSTVWLGINHRGTPGPPLIFETMIFGDANKEMQWRWSTEAEAIAGHEAICAAVRAGSDPEEVTDAT